MLVRVAAASTTALVLVLGFMVVLLPAYVAAFRYGFRSHHLWLPRPALEEHERCTD